ncbi:MAG: hypothetical protein U9N06_02570 [candidate division WOR-3 bacterium]|nr:hypothetical protein [candidate division WOR-3 bacterium]
MLLADFSWEEVKDQVARVTQLLPQKKKVKNCRNNERKCLIMDSKPLTRIEKDYEN